MSAFCVSSVFLGAFTYPTVRELGVGRRLALQAGRQLRSGRRLCDFAGSGVVHAVGGITALAWLSSSALASASTIATASSNAMPGHDMVIGADGLLHPGLRLVRIQPGQHARRFRVPCA